MLASTAPPATESQDGPGSGPYSQRATVVLVGGRGTGKSTLAVIASTALARPCIDADDYFHKQTGMSRSQYNQKHGSTEYARLELRMMQSLLYHHANDFVIVCGPSSINSRGRQLLMEYAKTNPVIHVVRCTESIMRYLGSMKQDSFDRLHGLSEPIFRSVANFEYFNLSEDFEAVDAGKSWNEAPMGYATTKRLEYPFLRLKRVEAEFVRFLHNILIHGRSQQHRASPEDGNDLASILRSTHTYILSLSLSELQARCITDQGFNCGADAFELRVDFLSHGHEKASNFPASILEEVSRHVAVVRRHFDGPIIYHVETSSDCAVYTPPERPSMAEDLLSYLELLRHGIRLAPEFITVNLRWADQKVLNVLATRSNIQLIGHYHESIPGSRGWTSSSRQAMYDRATSMQCDLVRLTQPATTAEDNFDVLRFQHQVSQSKHTEGTTPYLSAYNTGELGRTSCCLNKIFTPIYTQEGRQQIHRFDDHDTSPSLTLQQAQQSLYSSFLHNSLKFWVVGTDVSYSLSPAMHNAAYESCGIPHSFKIHQISCITELQDLVKDPYLGGCSLAEGYRISVLPLLHSMSSHAKAIGAVNTLVPIRTYWDPAEPPPLSFYHQRNQAGPIVGLYGENTDWIGIQRCVQRFLSPANAICQESTSLVIGAGAVARASLYALLRLGVRKILVFNRTTENAAVLTNYFNRLDGYGSLAGDSDRFVKMKAERAESMRSRRVEIVNSLDQEWPSGYHLPTIIVSCVPARASFTLPSKWLKSPTGGVMIDLAYKPLHTPMLMQIRSLAQNGWVTVDGLDYLPAQGSAQFRIFTGRKPPSSVMSKAVLRGYQLNEEQAEERDKIATRIEFLENASW